MDSKASNGDQQGKIRLIVTLVDVCLALGVLCGGFVQGFLVGNVGCQLLCDITDNDSVTWWYSLDPMPFSLIKNEG